MSDKNEQSYFIWCHERGKWWKPNSSGYTDKIWEAGKYSGRQAVQLCNAANRFIASRGPDESMVPVPPEPEPVSWLE